jgi:PAS domain S-box-containing protein
MEPRPDAKPAPGDEASRDKDEFCRLLVETMPQIAGRASGDGLATHFNRRWYEYTGQTAAEAQAYGWLAAVHPDDRPRVVVQGERALRSMQPYENVYRLRRASDGSYRWFLARVVPQRGPQGEVLSWFACATDIDDLKRAQDALRHSQRRFRALTENASDIMAVIDQAGKVVYQSPAGERSLGYSAEDMVGQIGFSFLHPDDVEQAGRLLQEVIQQPGATRRIEVRVRARDGSWPIHEVLTRNLLHDPAVRGVVINARDISERKQAEQEIANLNKDLQWRVNELETLFNTAPIGIAIAKDPQCREIRGNAAMTEMLGEPRGANLSKSALPGERPENYRAMRDGRELTPEELPAQRAAQGIPVIGAEFDVIQKNGRVVTVLGNATPLFDEQGEPRGAIAAFMDISELKTTQRQLQHATAAADAANQAKSQFLATMSHELRTPLTAILGFAELLSRADVSEESRYHYLRAVERNGVMLLRLIDDILDLTKIEAGETAIERIDVSPCQIIGEALSLTRPRAIEKHLDLQAEYVFPLPETIHTEPMRLRQILVNLLLNAIKFTEQGSVGVRVSLSAGEAAPVRLQISVRDTGIGISAEGIAKLFRPFAQVDSSIARRFGGTGLGLALSQRLARLLGGHIEVVSQAGQGSTFTLSLDPGPLGGVRLLQAPPEVRAAETPAESEVARRFRGRVLLVEDDADSREVVHVILKCAGLEVQEAENGQAGYLKALAAVGVDPYDLILMDVQMPEMDGYEATRRLRGAGWKGVIVALTAHAMSGDREKCLHAGCDDYLSKPITAKGLTALLARYLPPLTDLPAPAGPSSGAASFRQRGALDDTSISDDERAVMLAKFVRGLLPRMDEIERALRNEDRELLARAAHRLAGAAGLFGFHEIARSARTLAEHAQRPAGFAVFSAEVFELAGHCRQAAQAYRADPP